MAFGLLALRQYFTQCGPIPGEGTSFIKPPSRLYILSCERTLDGDDSVHALSVYIGECILAVVSEAEHCDLPGKAAQNVPKVRRNIGSHSAQDG